MPLICRLVRGTDVSRSPLTGRVLRMPPMHPEAFAAMLARKAFSNGRVDCEHVAGLYADALEGAFGGAENLNFSNLGWSDREYGTRDSHPCDCMRWHATAQGKADGPLLTTS